ncbi:unnamed protein product [Rotaria sordida]|uniref:Uncharacterized protein n=1 Tax=Rotaria sordida TaxID=392033 RepID=A0A814HTF1_9BILA|nr:unnamed protein product [Rotaria sordida]CAF1124021.1 unnamed protein product [Rotaria sordida]CAF1124924.1 unnamed protein product [Rotaria sordida]
MNSNRLDVAKHKRRISSKNIEKEEKLLNNSNEIEDMNIKQVDLQNRTAVVEQWLEGHQHDKHVQFSKNLTSFNQTNETKQERSYSFNNQSNEKLYSIDENNQQLNISTEKSIIKSNDLSNIVYNRQSLITDSRLYRSTNNDALSQSTFRSPSPLTRSRQSSFSSNPPIERDRTSSILSSIESVPSFNLSSNNKDRLCSLEINSSLSEIDRKKLDDIRQLVPDEFENIVPKLITLGVIIIPKKFFEINCEDMSGKDLIERHRLISLIKKDEDNIKHKEYLENFYGSISYDDKIYQKTNMLRETLSYNGKLALLLAYKDEIERELNKKIPQWKLIPIDNNRTNLSEYSYSTNRSSIISNPYKTRKKSTIISSSSIKTTKDLSLNNNQNYLLTLSLPDHIDNQWLNKSVAHSIEQAMILLDRLRLLSSNNLTNISYDYSVVQQNIYDNNQIQFVKQFKRWLLLCSILYIEHNSPI